jgi:hypothetical protein
MTVEVAADMEVRFDPCIDAVVEFCYDVSSSLVLCCCDPRSLKVEEDEEEGGTEVAETVVVAEDGNFPLLK